jgi:hypothetical protein
MDKYHPSKLIHTNFSSSDGRYLKEMRPRRISTSARAWRLNDIFTLGIFMYVDAAYDEKVKQTPNPEVPLLVRMMWEEGYEQSVQAGEIRGKQRGGSS